MLSCHGKRKWAKEGDKEEKKGAGDEVTRGRPKVTGHTHTHAQPQGDISDHTSTRICLQVQQTILRNITHIRTHTHNSAGAHVHTSPRYCREFLEATWGTSTLAATACPTSAGGT